MFNIFFLVQGFHKPTNIQTSGAAGNKIDWHPLVFIHSNTFQSWILFNQLAQGTIKQHNNPLNNFLLREKYL